MNQTKPDKRIQGKQRNANPAPTRVYGKQVGKITHLTHHRREHTIHSMIMATLSFFIPFMILLAVMARLGFYPFGTKSLLVMDMDGQYVHFYESLRQIVTGESSIFFSWSKAMGSNFIGLYAYYLASPLSFLTLLFRSDNIQLALFFLTLCKLSLCGLTFFLYLKYAFSYKGYSILVFSTSYALISYNVIYSLSLMWIDGVILLPLILLGAEKMLKKGKPYVFILSLTALFISNYYISYMTCVFAALFILYRYFTTTPNISILGFVKTMGKFLGFALLSVGMALWILLPTLFDLMSGKIGYQNYTPNTLTNFPLKGFIQSFSPNTYTSITNSGLPALYSGLTILILFFTYFFLTSIPVKKKIVSLLFSLFLLASFYFTKLDIAWHTFRYPNWFPYRYGFVFHFFAIFLAYCAFVKIYDKLKSLSQKWAKKLRVVIPILLIPLVSFDLYNNAKALWIGVDEQFHYQDVSSHRDFRNENLPLINAVKERDDSLYRLEKTYQRTFNDALGLGYKGVSHYSSTFHKNLLDFTRQLGFAQNWFWNSGSGSTALTDGLLDIKYVMSKREMPRDYQPISTSSDITVYENPFSLPIGYVVSGDAWGIDLNSDNCFENQNTLLNRFCGNDAAYFFKVEDINRYDNGRMNYQFTVKNDFPIYLSFPAGNNSGGSLYVNDEYVANYFTNDDNHAVYVGQFEIGSTVTVSFDASRENLDLRGEHIYYLNTDALYDAMQKLREGGLYNLTYRNSHIKAEVDAAKDGILFTSIPYDKGFTVKIDGKKTEYSSMNGTFLAFPIGGGHHNIEISFVPKGFPLGMGLSILSLLLLLMYGMYTKGSLSRIKKFLI